MLTLEQLKQAVHKKGVTKTDAALLCVAGGGAKGVSTAAVRDCPGARTLSSRLVKALLEQARMRSGDDVAPTRDPRGVASPASSTLLNALILER